ncbi:MAG: hypothetical protein WBQ72_22235 [Terriglobales bacterium]|jgi:hypothetical protein
MLKRATVPLLPVTLIVVSALVSLSYASDEPTHTYSQTATESWDFAPGGRLELHLHAGDLRIVPAIDSRISIRYTMQSNHADFIGKVKPEFDVKGPSAVLRLEAPDNGNIDVELQVPAQTDLYVRLGAGDIIVGPIGGNHDVETHAGDIQIRVPQPLNYGWVDASTHAGNISAPFGRGKGWIGSSLKYRGQGKYRVHVHTLAGDISFQEPESAQM